MESMRRLGDLAQLFESRRGTEVSSSTTDYFNHQRVWLENCLLERLAEVSLAPTAHEQCCYLAAS